jgi:hypothetical protein
MLAVATHLSIEELKQLEWREIETLVDILNEQGERAKGGKRGGRSRR